MPSAGGTPVRVYLDSSDVSNLAKADGTFAETRDALLALIQQGVLEARFSFFHIVELAHTSKEAKPDAVARAELLHQLCGAKAFLHPDKLYLYEAQSLIEDGHPENRKGSQARAYVEDATWLPDWIIAIAHQLAMALTRALEGKIVGIAKKIIDEMRLDRAMQRRTERHFLPNGKPSAEILEIVKGGIAPLVQKWREKLPFTPRFWSDNMLFRHLQGEISERELHDECLAAFSDPRSFIGWCVDEIPWVRDLPAEFRRSGLNNAQLVEELRQKMSQGEEFARELLQTLEPETGDKALAQKLRSFREALKRAVPPDMARSRDNEIENLFRANADKLDRLGVVRSHWDRAVGSSSVGALPAFDSLLEAANARFVDDAKTNRQMSHSDAGDLLHAAFIPYVDIFRADRSFRARIEKVANRFNTVLAPDLKGLPELVQTTADARRST